jgi:uncharacterized protein (TIGR03437 family)
VRILTCLSLALSCFAADRTTARPLILAFEARGSQYLARGPGYALSVTPSEAVLNLSGHAVRMRLEGADGTAQLDPQDPMPGRVSYLLGRAIRESYQLYGSVRSRAVYSGIDLLFHGNQRYLEYDFEIAAGADPANIQIDFDGADGISLDSTGALILGAGELEIHQPVPFAYQTIDGERMPVDVAYMLDSSHQVRFKLGAYDRTRALVIDPQLVFDTLFGGGNGSSGAADVALDAQGNIYVAGQTDSAGFPTQNAEQGRLGASPLLGSSDGGQTWTTPSISTSLVRSIASSPASPSTLYASIVSGVATSTDGGTTWTIPANAGLTSGVVPLAVDAGSASTVYAAGATGGVFISTNGGASWTASTNGLQIPNSIPPSSVQFTGMFANPAQPGTVFAIAQAPDFVYRSTDSGQNWAQVILPVEGGSPQSLAFTSSNPSTLILGQSTGNLLTSSDNGNTWTTISAQNVYGAQGLAISPGNPAILLGAGFNNLSRSADGGKTWTSVLTLNTGQVAFDPRNPNVAYALDSSGLYRSSDAGQTWTQAALPYEENSFTLFVSAADSRVFIGEGTQTDAFVTKYSPDGSQILYSTYLGGNSYDMATGIAVDSAGSAYVLGGTNSADFPVSSNAFQKTLLGSSSPSSPGFQDAFVAKLSPDGSQLVYSTLLGGGAERSARIGVDSAGEAVVTGSTSSAKFPVTAGAFQPTLNTNCVAQAPLAVPNSGAAFVSKISSTGGSLVFSTLLGGSCYTNGQAVVINANGNIWIAGSTTSPDFPVTKDAFQAASGGDIYDGFLARFSPVGSLAYATYVGGPGYDTVTGLAVDKTGNLYLTGTSGGLLQPASSGAFESQPGTTCPAFSIGPSVYQTVGSAFVLKLDSAAHNTLGLTYLGAPLCLFPAAIAVDSSSGTPGSVWIGGGFTPNGSAPQTVSPFQIGIGNGFVSKFSADFTQLLFSTYFDSVNGLALDSSGLGYVAGAGPMTGPIDSQQAYVAKIDPTPPSVSLDSVQNAVNPASPSNTQGIAAGEYLRLLGKNLGPSTPAPGIINGGVVASTDAGVTVTFDGVAVPLLSVSAAEIDLIAPFGLAGKSSTVVQVQYKGVESNSVKVAVSPRALQVLAVFNSGFTFDAATNPAQGGSIMTLYIAGVGTTNPPSQDGQVNGFPLASAPSPLTIVWPGNNPPTTSVPLTVTYAGAAPGLAAGIFQINFVAPSQSLSGVTLTVGTYSARFDISVH